MSSARRFSVNVPIPRGVGMPLEDEREVIRADRPFLCVEEQVANVDRPPDAKPVIDDGVRFFPRRQFTFASALTPKCGWFRDGNATGCSG